MARLKDWLWRKYVGKMFSFHVRVLARKLVNIERMKTAYWHRQYLDLLLKQDPLTLTKEQQLQFQNHLTDVARARMMVEERRKFKEQ